VLRAFVVPHAPLLLDLPGRPHPAPEIVEAVGALNIATDVVLVTPHGRAGGVYGRTHGSLRGFGLPGKVDLPTDRTLAGEIAADWSAPQLDEPLDHGAVVPLLLRPDVESAVVCALPGWTGQAEGDPSEALALAATLAKTLRRLAESTDLSVVISGHTSAAVTARSPLMERSEGREVDAAVREGLATDPGRLSDIAPDGWTRAGACGAGPFHLLGELDLLSLEVVHASAPFGVGYVVARSGS
jgi:hypothetical protein